MSDVFRATTVIEEIPETIFRDIYVSTEWRARFIERLAQLPPFHLVVGDVDEAILTMRQVKRGVEPCHVLVCSPVRDECLEYLLGLDSIGTISTVPYPSDLRDRRALVAVSKGLPSCLGIGLKAVDGEYADMFTDEERRRWTPAGFEPQPISVHKENPVRPPRVVIHAHDICVPVQRSERPIINPRWWHRLMALAASLDADIVITGDVSLSPAYPAPDGCIDVRSASRVEQRTWIRSADIFISSDCPELVVAADNGATCIHCTPLLGHDLEGAVNHRRRHAYSRFSGVRSAETQDEALNAFHDAVRLRGIRPCVAAAPPPLPSGRVTEDHVRRVGSSVLTSFHPVFTDRSYGSAKNVLIKSSKAVGDSLITTQVIRSLSGTYPGMAIDVSGPPHILDVYRSHPDIRRRIVRGTAEELLAEAVADEVIEFNFIIDRFPEYYHGIHLYDTLGNIAGVRLHSKDVVYSSTEEELKVVREAIEGAWSSVKSRLIVCTQFGTDTDPQRSYPHGGELTRRLLDLIPGLCIVNVGTSKLGVSHERLMECSDMEGWGLREHIAAVRVCDKAIMIDSSFLHVAHNLWRKPTLMLESITRHELVVDGTKRTVRAVRNVAHGCTACYWQSPPCKRDCMKEFSSDRLLPEVTRFLLDSEMDVATYGKDTSEPHVSIDGGSQDVARTFYENLHKRELIVPTITVTSGTPSYVHSWNGVRFEESSDVPDGTTGERLASPSASRFSPHPDVPASVSVAVAAVWS